MKRVARLGSVVAVLLAVAACGESAGESPPANREKPVESRPEQPLPPIEKPAPPVKEEPPVPEEQPVPEEKPLETGDESPAPAGEEPSRGDQ